LLAAGERDGAGNRQKSLVIYEGGIEMRYKLQEEEYEKIKELVDYALSASNKAEAKRYIQQLNYAALGLQGAANNILQELIASVNTASGQVSDKERKSYFAQMDLYKLKDFVE